MKIKQVRLTEKDKRKAYKTAVRKALMESGRDKLLQSKVYKNKKKYSRKEKHRISNED